VHSMTYKYTQLTPILHGWPTVLLFAACGTVLAVLLSLLRPLEYSSSTSILITQELGVVDAYTASRSAERIADDLSSIVYTSTFYDKVMNSGYSIDTDYFPEDPIKERDRWEKTISASVARSSGLLDIRAYHPDVSQAEEIARAVAFVLTTQGWTYTSGGNITVQVVDDPLNSRYPVRPNIPVNAISGFFLGALGGAAYVSIQAERLRRRHQMVHTDI
jgi:capsular polysaccharide biosynthesis protein